MPRYSMKVFYSAKITMLFVLMYCSIPLVFGPCFILLLSHFSNMPTGLIVVMSMGGFAGTVPVLLMAPPTKLTVHDGNFFYIIKDVENIITDFQYERSSYGYGFVFGFGFPWGYKKKEIGSDKIFLIPQGSPRCPNGMFGKKVRESFIRIFSPFGGLTSIVEIQREGDLINIYGSLVTIKKIYDEII